MSNRTNEVRFYEIGEQNAITRNYFPTSIAVDFCVMVGLYPKKHTGVISNAKKREEGLKQVRRLKWFQELSMHGDFDDAMVAYHGIKLSKKQKKILKLIHALTGKQARGHLADAIFRKLRKGCESKDMKSLGELLLALEATDEKSEETANKGIEAYVVNAIQK